MEYRALGRSGLQVSAFSLGTMTFGGTGRHKITGNVDKREAERMAGLCIEAGINLFDSADSYSAGLAEEILGYAIRSQRERVLIATKAFGRTGDGPNDAGTSRHHLIVACEASLRRLHTDYIDLYQLHHFDPQTPIEESLRALDGLVRAGKVRYVGISNFAGWQLMKALAVCERANVERIISQQIYYSLESRDAENELVPLGLDQGVGILVWSPLAFGALSGRFRFGSPPPQDARSVVQGVPGQRPDVDRIYRIVEVLEEVARARGVPIPQVALNWVRQRPGVSSVIVGARNETQLKENLAAADWTLSPREIDLLDAVSEKMLPYPYNLQAMRAGRAGDIVREGWPAT